MNNLHLKHTCSFALRMLSSKRSTSISRRYRSAAIQRARQATSAVVLAVTLGLPSLSPPIQDPKDRGRASMGSSWPVCRLCTAQGLLGVPWRGVELPPERGGMELSLEACTDLYAKRSIQQRQTRPACDTCGQML